MPASQPITPQGELEPNFSDPVPFDRGILCPLPSLEPEMPSLTTSNATCFHFQVSSLSAFFTPVIFHTRAVSTQGHTWSATASTLGYLCLPCSYWSGQGLCSYCFHRTKTVFDFMDRSTTSTIQQKWPLEPA